MEIVVSLAIGVLGGSGVWLLLRPRTLQVLLGLALLSYAVNLFIFAMGRLYIRKEPIIVTGQAADLLHYADPVPQALVLTAIVIGFGMTALFLVVLLASRGLSGTDHVDGEEDQPALADAAAAASRAATAATSGDALPAATTEGSGREDAP